MRQDDAIERDTCVEWDGGIAIQVYMSHLTEVAAFCEPILAKPTHISPAMANLNLDSRGDSKCMHSLNLISRAFGH